MATVQELVKELEKKLELPRPIRSEIAGVWSLPVDEGVIVTISEFPPGYAFFCPVAECPTTKVEDFLTHAMTANLLGDGTEGGVLGLDADGKKLTLAMENIRGGDYKQFEQDLEAFLAAVNYWRDEAKKSIQ